MAWIARPRTVAYAHFKWIIREIGIWMIYFPAPIWRSDRAFANIDAYVYEMRIAS
jgi:hypothetical protein